VDNITKGSGKEELSMDQECGEGPKETLISANGNKERPMDTASTLGLMVTGIKASLSNA
jgi:hypothetical protein